jgi:hypothetical protein
MIPVSLYAYGTSSLPLAEKELLHAQTQSAVFTVEAPRILVILRASTGGSQGSWNSLAKYKSPNTVPEHTLL